MNSNKDTLNKSLHKAKEAKYDDFYTQLSDIERELKHYKEHFNGKTIYCNCDDPTISNFHKYFCLKFNELGLKKLITTCYKNQQRDLFSTNSSEKAIWLEYEGTKNSNGIPDKNEIKDGKLNGDGDFRSKECINLLRQANIIVTNPPFSLFREYIAQLMDYKKKFIIIGSLNAITYKEIFKLLKENRLWLGYGFERGNAYFKTLNPKAFAKGVYNEETGLVKFRNVTWFTNLDIQKRHEELILYKKYAGHEDEYPKYDNYDGINVNETKNIPEDYTGVLGVPISFLDKYNSKQFSILKCSAYSDAKYYGCGALYVNEKKQYARILIKTIK